MDTVSRQRTTSDERILLELEARSIEESDALAAQAQTGPQWPVRAADARLWAEADADALSQLSHSSQQAALDVIARNLLASSAYAEQFDQVSPKHAMAAQPVAHAQQLAQVIATHLPLPPDSLLERGANWPAHVTDYFRVPDQHPQVWQHLARLLSGISKDSLIAFQAKVASILAPASKDHHELTAASSLRVHTAWDLSHEEQVRQVARVISANANLVPWKVDANLRREPGAVRALLADPVQMRVLEKDVAALIAVPVEHVAQVHAMIEQSSQSALRPNPHPLDTPPRPARADSAPRDDDALQLVANFIASAQSLTPEAVYARARYAPPALQAILGNSRQMRELDDALGAHLAFLPADRIADVQATIATALGRADAEQRVKAAQAMRAPAAPPSSPDRPSPETVQRAIDFLASATTLYDDKIPDRLAIAPTDVKAVLADADRMRDLDAAINARLEHILPDRLAAAQAVIAVTLNRPDAEQRVQTAQALRADRAVPEHPKAPATPTAPAAQTELQTLRAQFRQHIASATPTGDKQLSIAELQDRIAIRHRLYDNLAIATRMERGQAIMGGAQPQALRGVVSSGLAAQWARLDAADLQSMLRAAENRLEHLAPIQSAVNLINGTSGRDRVYQSSLSQVAPTMREDIAAARQRRESLAVAEFIRANHTNPEWKIQSNLDRAAPALQHILKDGKRIGELDATVQEHLPELESAQRHAVLAAIAGDLQRADSAANRAAPPSVHKQAPVAQAEQAHIKASPLGTAIPEPTPPAAISTSADKVTTLQSMRNGIVPASGVPADHAPVVKKLLEDMSYKIRTDGSVLYQVQGKDAFVDHGDQLLMVKGAEKEERAILGALLLAKEKYAGAFELTGSEAFKRAAIEVLAKYKLDVRLKNPEQDLLRKEAGGKQAQQAFTRATPEHPAVPVDMAPLAAHITTSAIPTASAGAPQRGSTSQDVPRPGKPVPAESADTSTANLLQGRLLGHGAAPLKNAKDGKPSYFVQIQNPNGESRTFWGLDLERALLKSGAQKGDEIVLQNLGRKPVQVNVPTHDNAGNVTGIGTVISHRNAWEISTLQPVARRSEAIATAEASPALPANSVAVREAAWWQRQIPLVQACMEQNPALRGKIEELGPRPDSRDVAWIDTHGDRRVVANDISYGALCDRMPSIKDCLQPVVAMEGGTLDGQSQTAGLKLIRASENYLQGVAQVDGKMRHVVALLPSASSDASHVAAAPIPLMAAIPAPDGFTWERVGQLRADKPAPGAVESKEPATMNVEIGRETIPLKLHAQPGDSLHQRLGLSAASDHPPGQKEATVQRQQTSGNRTNAAPTRPTKPDTPSYA